MRSGDKARSTHPRGSPPLKPGIPGQRSSLGLKVTADIKDRLDAAARTNGRSQSQEAEARIEWSFDFERQMGGPRSLRLFLHGAQIPQILFDDESAWHDHRPNWDLVMHLLSEAFDARAPAPLDRQQQIAVARDVVDEFRRTKVRRRREHLRQVLLSMSIDARLPEHVRLECMGAAVMPDEISLDEKIDAGRRVAEKLRSTADPARRSYLQEVLIGLSNYDAFPEAVREEFAEAAASSVVPLPSSSSPAGLVPDETRPRHVHLFDAAWRLAAIAAGRTKTPDEAMIAQTFSEDEALFVLAEMGDVAHDATAVLHYRQQIEQQRANTPPGPSGDAAPSPRSARRRRAARAARE